MSTLTFGDQAALWALAAPGTLLMLWLWRALLRTRDRRQLRSRRTLPRPEPISRAGDLAFWLSAIVSSALLIVALARPLAPSTLPQRGGLDVVVLQDASASMRVRDVGATNGGAAPDRWQRSMQVLRELGDALSWTSDRLAMIAFAHIATPQIRLTRDPNTLFFFLDHLQARPPFRLEDETTWDTNLEEAVGWGLRVVDKDEEIHGRSSNTALFVLLSDGEAWSGEVAAAVERAAARGIPLFVIGVGSLGGGRLPVVRLTSGEVWESPGISRLERASLQRIAREGRGDYFELDRDGDRAIANAIVAAGRRLTPAASFTRTSTDLYPWFVLAAASVALAGLLVVRQVAELGVLLCGAVASALWLASLLW